jgi:hypothetical protein
MKPQNLRRPLERRSLYRRRRPRRKSGAIRGSAGTMQQILARLLMRL